MDIELEFFDETGKPLVFPEWPGGMKEWVPAMPKRDLRADHRLLFTSQYLSTFSVSLSMNDTVGQLKQVVVKTLPYMHTNLAVGRVIDKVMFLGEDVTDSSILSSHTVRVVKTASEQVQLTGRKECFQIFTKAVIRALNTTTNATVEIVFEGPFDPATVSCGDVMKQLQKDPSVYHSHRLVREYPTIRSFLCADNLNFYGFAGTKERGIWKHKPHKGPLTPCKLTTPPVLRLILVDTDVAERFEREDEWWGIIRQQPGWIGHQETFSGAKEAVTMVLREALPPSWLSLTTEGSTTNLKGHTLWKKKLHIPSFNGVLAASMPYPSSVTKQAIFHEDVKAAPRNDGAYFPTPKEISEEGTSYEPVVPWRSYGSGKIKSGTAGTAMQMMYQMTVEENLDVKLVFSSMDTSARRDDQTPEHIYEGTLATGLTQTQYFRGVHYYRWLSDKDEAILESRKVPFCLFQLTPSGTVPDLITSAVGLRVSGLKDRSYTVITRKGAGLVGYADDFTPKDVFFSKLPENEASIVSANLAFLSEGIHTNATACILWRISTADDVFIPVPEVNRIKAGCEYVIKAHTMEEVEETFQDIGKLIGVGPDPATTTSKRPSFNPVARAMSAPSIEVSTAPAETSGNVALRRASSAATSPKKWQMGADGKWLTSSDAASQGPAYKNSPLASVTRPLSTTGRPLSTTSSNSALASPSNQAVRALRPGSFVYPSTSKPLANVEGVEEEGSRTGEEEGAETQHGKGTMKSKEEKKKKKSSKKPSRDKKKSKEDKKAKSKKNAIREVEEEEEQEDKDGEAVAHHNEPAQSAEHPADEATDEADAKEIMANAMGGDDLLAAIEAKKEADAEAEKQAEKARLAREASDRREREKAERAERKASKRASRRSKKNKDVPSDSNNGTDATESATDGAKKGKKKWLFFGRKKA